MLKQIESALDLLKDESRFYIISGEKYSWCYDAINHTMYSVDKDILNEINKSIPVWVELGLQTIHEETAIFINRGYKLNVFEEDFFKNLNTRGDNLNTSLEEWKFSFDSKLNEITKYK